jgi:rhodanese-related sulfurtransferase
MTLPAGGCGDNFSINQEVQMGIENIGAEDLRKILRERPEEIEVIDVRDPDEYEKAHIRGSKLIPVKELPQRVGEIDWQKEVVFVCRSGRRSRLTAELASAAGVAVKNLQFGILECMKSGEPVFLESGTD